MFTSILTQEVRIKFSEEVINVQSFCHFVCMLNFEHKNLCHGLLNFNMVSRVFLTNFEVFGNVVRCWTSSAGWCSSDINL